MKIYWGLLILSLFICMWFNKSYDVYKNNGKLERRGRRIQGWIFFLPLIFFVGLRSYVGDTATYIGVFNSYPSVLDISTISTFKDKGFVIFSILYKQFISANYQGWLMIIAIISCVATMKGFLRYSEDFGMTCFLFIASTMFMYLLNGMRQYICVSILFACTYMIFKRKIVVFVLLILFLSTIHGSAILFLAIIPMVYSKPWSIRMILFTALTVVCALQFNRVFSSFSEILEHTQYAGYVDYINNSGVGSNIIRLLITMVPVGISFYGRKTVEQEGNELIYLCVNMSVINMCVYIIATASSGMAVGRVATYFDIYNMILIPWLINHMFKGSIKSFIRVTCFLLYILFFWFQMVITWHMSYGSDFLGIQYRWY